MYVLVLSDIHANAMALRAVREKEPEAEALWFLGDLIGYGPDVEEVVRWFLEALGTSSVPPLTLWVPGNHDVAALRPEVWKEKTMNPQARAVLDLHIQWMKQAELWEVWSQVMEKGIARLFQEGVDEDPRNFLPFYEHGETLWLLSHAGLQPREARVGWYLYPWSQATWAQLQLIEAWRQRQGLQRVILLTGHTHFPMALRQYGEKACLQDIPYEGWITLEEGSWLINPGSLGQPRDGDVRGSYLVVHPEKARVGFRRVAYDWRATVQTLWDRFPPSLAEHLEKWFESPALTDERVHHYYAFYDVQGTHLHARKRPCK